MITTSDIKDKFGMLLAAYILEMLKRVWGKVCPGIIMFIRVTSDDAGESACLVLE